MKANTLSGRNSLRYTLINVSDSNHKSVEAFEKEILVHYKYFLDIAVRLTKSYPDAQDLIQDTFMRAYRFFHTYERGSNSKAWIYRIMKNLFINYSRKKTSHPTSSIDAIIYEPQTQSDEQNVMRYDITRLMEKIKDEYRMVIILFHLEEFSLIEISQTLNWPLGTVKSRLHRARKEFIRVLRESEI
jgi:RNA polymerase sigma-70 factor, ECF subfamily